MEAKCMQMYPSASKCVQRKVLNYISLEMVNVKPPKIAPEKSENDVCSQNEWSG